MAQPLAIANGERASSVRAKLNALIVKSNAVVSVVDFGAVGDGVTDDSAAFNAASEAVVAGGQILIPPGTYQLSSQWTLSNPSFERISVWAFGVTIKTAGEISGLRLTGGGSACGVTVHGLHVDHRGNSDAIAGIDVFGATNARLNDCTVVCSGTRSGYAGILVRNRLESDPDYGSFWAQLVNCKVLRRSSSDGAKSEYGVLLQGASNATNILGCSISSVETCIGIEPHADQTYLANGVVIHGNALEAYTTGIKVEGATGSTFGGLRVMGNRFENGVTMISLQGMTSQPTVAPFLCGNYAVSSAGTYLDNPNDLYVTSLDAMITPAPSVPFSIVHPRGVRFRGTDASYDTLDLWSPTIGSGMAMRTATGALYASWRPKAHGGGTGTVLKGDRSAIRPLGLAAVSGLSWTDTEANNLRGSVTFAGETSKTVTFAVAEADASYFIFLSAGGDAKPWWESRATSGFTIKTPAAFTGTVQWFLVR
jgi:hypothetical protein